ncbi:MAG TPA: cellulase family glycosylhydrolase [Thermoleophilaceae bacterium]|jgi:hypothetical protein
MTRRLRHAALVLALTAVSAFTFASAAQAANGMEVALQDDPLFVNQSYFGIGKALDLAADLKASRLRVNVVWGRVVKSASKKKKPGRVVYDWAIYDRLVNAVSSRGIRLQLTLSGPAPAWATGNRKIGVVKPKASQFGDFAREAAKHFKGLVDRYSIWNEPQLKAWISPLKSNAKIYRALYVAGYNAIKSVDPTAKVLIGETSPFSLPKGRATAPIKFLKAVTKRGHLVADGYAHHPYDFRHPITYNYPGKDNATLKTLGNLTGALDKLASSGKLTTSSGRALDLYLTEWGYMAPGNKYAFGESKRSQFLRQGFDMAVANPRVKQMLQYVLVRPAKKYRFFDMSLVSKSGTKTPAFDALASWARDAAAAGKITVPGPGYRAP